MLWTHRTFGVDTLREKGLGNTYREEEGKGEGRVPGVPERLQGGVVPL